MLTRVGLESVRENLSRALGIPIDRDSDLLSAEANGMLELSGVRAPAMEAFLKHFEACYSGGVEDYLTTRLGFSADDVKVMRENLTLS